MAGGTPVRELEIAHDGDLLRSGSTVGRNASARAGFMPLALEHLVLEGLATIPVYFRTMVKRGGEVGHHFTLYCTAATRFTEQHRIRLREAGVKFIYIALQNQMQFRQQVEAHLESAMTDPATTITAKSELIYETSLELVNELLAEQGMHEKLPRLETISKAVTSLVMNDASAFSHLFAASQHDFYTATHMVNVGTWMVPLAYAMGVRSMDELNMMCFAGMMHDVGKIFVPEEVLNKKGKLSEDDWRQLRAHPALGVNHLKKCGDVSEIVLRVAGEHHERMDGTGYPGRLKGEQMHLASRICAVVDSFDAMTAFRPFKERTQTFAGALAILKNEAPHKYDQAVVDAWYTLMHRAAKDGTIAQSLTEVPNGGVGRRQHERFAIECPARVCRMEFVNQVWVERQAMQVTAHNLSRAGIGFLSRVPLPASQYLRIQLQGTGSLADRVFDGQSVRCRAYTDGWHEVGVKFASLAAEIKAAEENPVAIPA